MSSCHNLIFLVQKVGNIFGQINNGNGMVIIRGSSCIWEPVNVGFRHTKIKHWNDKNIKLDLLLKGNEIRLRFYVFLSI